MTATSGHSREARLAKALRENLKRRKAQARATAIDAAAIGESASRSHIADETEASRGEDAPSSGPNTAAKRK
jgi:hypothetical protein